MYALVSPDDYVPKSHPIRQVKQVADACLRSLEPQFAAMYAQTGRASVPPERLLKGSLLMALFSVRSERQLCEQIHYNLMFRWFLDMDLTEQAFDATTFCKNRERLMQHEAARAFFEQVVAHARSRRLLSKDHFTVDGTLIEAWASLKSLRPKDEAPQDREPPDDKGNPTVDFHGEKRGNATHASTTDPEAKLARKGPGKEAKLCYGAHALMENRNGLLIDLHVAGVLDETEREAALRMLERSVRGRHRVTVAADKGYDTHGFIDGCRELRVTPHVAQNSKRRGGSAIDHRTTRHGGYRVSQRIRKRVEEIFGWCKTVGGFRRTRYKGRDRTQLAAWLVGAAYNLLRIAKLVPASA
jgi:transposase